MHGRFQRGLLLCGLGLALLAVRTAEAASDRLSPSDIFKLQLAEDPQISPDGARIVYVRKFADAMSDRRLSNLWIVNFDGTGHRALTTGPSTDTSPRWSPDGSRILFISSRDGSPQIYSISTDKGVTTKLTDLPEAPQTIAWSPDGTQIAFSSFVPEAPRAYAALPDPPPGATWKPLGRVVDRLVYRLNGVGYLRPGYSHLFLMPAEGGAPRQVSRCTCNERDPVWTPDGKSLIFSADRQPDEDDEDPRGTEIYELSIADGSIRALTSRKGPDQAPAVSPDGKSIAYVGFDDAGYDYQVRQLYVMNRDGSASRALSARLDRDVESPRWAPDGSGIYFMYVDQGATKLGFYSLDGRLREITRTVGGGRGVGVQYTGEAGSASFSLARNGRFAFTYSRADVPCDVGVGPSTDGSVRVITAVNDELLKTKGVGAIEEIWYPSSLDGRKIQGWIIKPPGFDPSKKYPLILEIHGGPHASFGGSFDVERQLMAAAGYVVFYPNYRGSTGYGFDFAHLIEKVHPGIAGDERNPGDVVHDLNSGVDAVIARGYVDPNNLFISGLSAGGTLTFWMIAHTDRFRAAAPQCPSGANWSSFVLYAGRPSLVKYRFPGVPWEHAEHYAKRSPISIIKNVKTPTMILGGDEDYLTPIANMEEYYFALKLLKIETVLIDLPGEIHGLWRYPSHHVAKMLYILSWFDQHQQKTSGSRGQ